MHSILKTSGATAFYLAIFLNATIDLGHKITIQNTVFKVHDGAYQIILIALINALILLPYILLVVPVGRIANRTAKPALMKTTAWCSLLLTVVITLFYGLGWFWPAFVITVLMATQSAFYSPAKLSYLKVMFGEHRLAESNGLAQSVVIAGILLGTVIFSLGFEFLYNKISGPNLLDSGLTGQVQDASTSLIDKVAVTTQMWPLGIALILLAAIQVFFVYRVPTVPEILPLTSVAAIPDVSDNKSRRIFTVFADRKTLLPILMLALFWSVGQGMLAAFPAFAKAHAGIDNAAVIQGILASTAVGIALGAFLVGRLSVGGINLNWVAVGVVGLSAGLWSLTFLSTALGFALAYFNMGVASAFLIVPMNAYIQRRAAGDKIGGVIAASNFIQNIAMLAMLALTIAFALADFDSQYLLQMMALLTTVLGGLLAWLIVGFDKDECNR